MRMKGLYAGIVLAVSACFGDLETEANKEDIGKHYWEYLDLDENCLYDVTRMVFEKGDTRRVISLQYHPELQLTGEQALGPRGANLRTRFLGCAKE